MTEGTSDEAANKVAAPSAASSSSGDNFVPEIDLRSQQKRLPDLSTREHPQHLGSETGHVAAKAGAPSEALQSHRSQDTNMPEFDLGSEQQGLSKCPIRQDMQQLMEDAGDDDLALQDAASYNNKASRMQDSGFGSKMRQVLQFPAEEHQHQLSPTSNTGSHSSRDTNTGYERDEETGERSQLLTRSWFNPGNEQTGYGSVEQGEEGQVSGGTSSDVDAKGEEGAAANSQYVTQAEIHSEANTQSQGSTGGGNSLITGENEPDHLLSSEREGGMNLEPRHDPDKQGIGNPCFDTDENFSTEEKKSLVGDGNIIEIHEDKINGIEEKRSGDELDNKQFPIKDDNTGTSGNYEETDEPFWKVVFNIIIPFVFAGFGTVATGLMLDKVQV